MAQNGHRVQGAFILKKSCAKKNLVHPPANGPLIFTSMGYDETEQATLTETEQGSESGQDSNCNEFDLALTYGASTVTNFKHTKSAGGGDRTQTLFETHP